MPQETEPHLTLAELTLISENYVKQAKALLGGKIATGKILLPAALRAMRELINGFAKVEELAANARNPSSDDVKPSTSSSDSSDESDEEERPHSGPRPISSSLSSSKFDEQKPDVRSVAQLYKANRASDENAGGSRPYSFSRSFPNSPWGPNSPLGSISPWDGTTPPPRDVDCSESQGLFPRTPPDSPRKDKEDSDRATPSSTTSGSSHDFYGSPVTGGPDTPATPSPNGRCDEASASPQDRFLRPRNRGRTRVLRRNHDSLSFESNASQEPISPLSPITVTFQGRRPLGPANAFHGEIAIDAMAWSRMAANNID